MTLSRSCHRVCVPQTRSDFATERVLNLLAEFRNTLSQEQTKTKCRFFRIINDDGDKTMYLEGGT